MALANLFAVVSWGRSGTVWLAKLLNAHPQVLCLHHWRADMTAAAENAVRLSDLEYMRTIEIHARDHQYALAGDCHGIEAGSIAGLREAFGPRFRACILTRHPIPRTDSYLRFAKRIGFEYYGLNGRKLRRTLPPSLRRLGTTDMRLFFVHVLNMVNNIAESRDIGPIFALETLTASPTRLNALLRYVSNGELRFSRRMIGSIYPQKLNVGKRRTRHTKDRTPEETFFGWEKWKQELFAGLFSPAARSVHEGLGHRFDFLDGINTERRNNGNLTGGAL